MSLRLAKHKRLQKYYFYGSILLLNKTKIVSIENSLSEQLLLDPAPEQVTALLELPHRVDFDNPRMVVGAGLRIPMIGATDMNETDSMQSLPDQELNWQMDVDIPMNRIIGIDTFDSWAGRGGKRGTGGRSSLSKIIEYAKRGQPEEYSGFDAPRFRLVKDVDGHIWAYCVEGAHRTAAAKLRGDETVRHADVVTGSGPWLLNFSVANRLAEKKNKTDSMIRRTIVRLAGGRIVRQSAKLDNGTARNPVDSGDIRFTDKDV